MSFSHCEYNNLKERENRNPNFISSTYFIFLSSLTKSKGKTMEWNSLKDNGVASKAIRDCNNNNTTNNNDSQNSSNKLKDSWISNSQSCGEDYLGGFSWPPRSYTCSFCKREFRSAQALGGHMNVHRRDRARLRQSPPRDGQYPFLNLNVNPNPNPNISNPPSVSPSFTGTLPSQVSPPVSSLSSPSSASPSEMKKCGTDGTLTDSISQAGSDLNKNKSFKCFLGVNEFDGFTEEDGCHQVPKKPAEIFRLDLEIGLIRDSKEDLDLELRLGYS